MNSVNSIQLIEVPCLVSHVHNNYNTDINLFRSFAVHVTCGETVRQSPWPIAVVMQNASNRTKQVVWTWKDMLRAQCWAPKTHPWPKNVLSCDLVLGAPKSAGLTKISLLTCSAWRQGLSGLSTQWYDDDECGQGWSVLSELACTSSDIWRVVIVQYTALHICSF